MATGSLQNGGTDTFTDHVDFLISARGFLLSWSWPSIPGIETFQGMKVHSAAWDHSYDYSHKKIAIIGNGSSGIQILPEMAKPELQNMILGRDVPDPNPAYTEDDKQRFRDPAELRKYRRTNVNKNIELFVKGSDYNAEMTESAAKQMKEKLYHNPVLCEKLIPNLWIPDQRWEVSGFRPHNLRNGVRHISVPSFPVTGNNSVSLAKTWPDEPEGYLSLACPDMPNLFFFTGPNATVGHGSFIFSLDWSAEWMIQWIQKMACEDNASVAPEQDVVDELARYGDQIHKTLTWTGGCRSWYEANRVNGKVTATFAGSAILYEMLVNGKLRPEDFEIKYRSANRWRFLGNGFTAYELKDGHDLSYYIP